MAESVYARYAYRRSHAAAHCVANRDVQLSARPGAGWTAAESYRYLRRMPLSLNDLARAAAGCCALAQIYCQDAANQSRPMIREGLEREVAVLAQTEFTEVQYTDTAGAQSFLTANASFTTSDGYSFWKWFGGGVGSFTNGDQYTISFS
ncbi:MAG TPA: hypothetical protein VMU40_07640 [Steroidobacteraceae bacterium]|nr:hypothetical protein [Steroidobacteraceae bacterium]